MTGQTVSPRSLAASISATRSRDALLDDGEDLLDGAAGGLDAGAQRGLDLADRRLQVGGGGLPVRQRRQVGACSRVEADVMSSSFG